MRKDSSIMSQRHVQSMRRALFISLGVTVLAIAISGFRLLGSKMRKAELIQQIKAQKVSLAKLQENAGKHAPASTQASDSDADAVARLQTDIERTAHNVN